MKILMVEDDSNISSYVKLAMEDLNYTIDIASDGITGMQMALDNDYDTVILDVMLPGMNGFDICRKIRNSVKSPIMMLTSMSSIEDRVRGFHCGADGYMAKPFRIEELNDRINALCLLKKSTY